MSSSHNNRRLFSILPELTLTGQEAVIRVMNALGFKANKLGVCCGLSHSARDAFLAGSLPQFFQHLQLIQTVYESCVKTMTANILKTEQQEFKEIENLGRKINSGELSFEQRQSFSLIVNNKIAKVKQSMQLLSDYSNDPDNSFLAEIIQNMIAEKIDVVLHAKFLVLKELFSEYGDAGISRELSLYTKLSYLDKSQKMEKLLQVLSTDPAIKAKLAEKIKQKLSAIPEVLLNFSNHTQALFTRIAAYQKAENYLNFFNAHELTSVQTENVKRIHPMVESNQLNALGGLEKIASFTGCYTLADLTVYFQTLLESLSSSQKPVALNLGSSHHAIMMGYSPDPNERGFVFYNPNTPIVAMNDAGELAKNVMSAFSKRKIYVVNSLPDASNLNKYYNHYLVIRDKQGLFYLNAKANLQALNIKSQQEFLKMMANLPDGPLPENHLLTALEEMIKKNPGHELLGASVAILTTDVSILKNDNSNKFSGAIHEWHQNKLADRHKVTPEKMLLTDGMNANWFQRALLSNDIDTVKHFLANSTVVNYADLVAAIKNQYSDLVTLLIPHVSTPLMIAAYAGDIDIVRELLKNKVDVNQSAFDLCPLAVAVTNNNVPLVELLLEFGANPYRAYPENSETPFDLATSDENNVILTIFNNSKVAKEAFPEGDIDLTNNRQKP